MNRKVLIIPAIILAVVAVVVVIGVVIPIASVDPNSPIGGTWTASAADGSTLEMKFYEDGTGWVKETHPGQPNARYTVEWFEMITGSGVYRAYLTDKNGEHVRTDYFEIENGKFKFLDW